MMRAMIRGAAVAALLFASAAMAEPAPREVSTLVVSTAGGRHSLRVELATTAEERARGLMERRELAADAGMLFDFGGPREITMWMKNTYVPLDMVFATAEGRVVGVARNAVPHSLRPIRSPGPVSAVLEVPAGTAARLGIVPGTRLLHPVFGSDGREAQ